MGLFGTSGIRRIVDRELVELALKVGMAVGTAYSDVVIGRDTRTSGPTLLHAVTAGILSSGARCQDAGIVPTPTLGFVSRQFKAGIMITASHNPPQYNGLKLLNPDGSAFSPRQQDEIETLISQGTPQSIKWELLAAEQTFPEAAKKHANFITTTLNGKLKLKVVVDAGCGAAYFITPYLLEQLGCEVIKLNCYPEGKFPHDVEPVEANLGDLMVSVKQNQADLGIAHDGDADRMMAVDDRSRFISGDKMLSILAEASGEKTIVTTIDASMAVEEKGLKVIRTRVGDPFVSEELKKLGGFGGETSGAWVFPQISLCPDGIFAAAKLAQIAARHRLSDLVDSIPSYPLIRGNLAGTLKNLDGVKEQLIDKLKPNSIDTIDGIKLNFTDGWCLIRPSGTEPKIRLTVEARNENMARHLYENVGRIVKEAIAAGL